MLHLSDAQTFSGDESLQNAVFGQVGEDDSIRITPAYREFCAFKKKALFGHPSSQRERKSPGRGIVGNIVQIKISGAQIIDEQKFFVGRKRRASAKSESVWRWSDGENEWIPTSLQLTPFSKVCYP